MEKVRNTIISLCLLAGCTSSPWMIDTIATGDTAFDSSRAQCASATPLSFEMLKWGETVASFLNLKNFRAAANTTTATVLIDEQPFTETIHVHEGRMRMKLSSDTTEKIILALQKGQKVRIMVDGFETEVDADPAISQFLR